MNEPAASEREASARTASGPANPATASGRPGDADVPLERTPTPARIPLHTQLPLLVALIVLWLVLWQHVDVISVVSGIVFAVLVVRVFYLPPVVLSDRFHLGWFLVLTVRMLWWIIRASWQVAWLALRPAPLPRSAIVKTHLHTDSDWLQTLAAEVNMLVPGSVVVEVDRSDRLIFLHVLDADSDEKVERARRAAFDIEVAIALAFASRRELVRISEARVRLGLPPLPGIAKARARAKAKKDAAARAAAPLATAPARPGGADAAGGGKRADVDRTPDEGSAR